ncbi:MAG: hypothetical protein SF052_22945 [Bacteroidia bacterium]|nr:hypothetical protein [Bacteroidia bacterium]
MTSFQSNHYPKSRNGVAVLQEYAMQYYGALNLILMLAVIVKVYAGGYGQSVLWLAVIGEVAALGLGNLLAYGKLRRTIAEIFFVNDHFSMISVYEILFKGENNAFPLIYANPDMLNEDTVSIHFNDQILTLYRKDWEEFDLIRDYLFSRQY